LSTPGKYGGIWGVVNGIFVYKGDYTQNMIFGIVGIKLGSANYAVTAQVIINNSYMNLYKWDTNDGGGLTYSTWKYTDLESTANFHITGHYYTNDPF